MDTFVRKFSIDETGQLNNRLINRNKFFQIKLSSLVTITWGSNFEVLLRICGAGGSA